MLYGANKTKHAIHAMLSIILTYYGFVRIKSGELITTLGENGMFHLKIDMTYPINPNVVYVCNKCYAQVNKIFWADTPARTIYTRCSRCQSKLPDHEAMLRCTASRARYHFTCELPESPYTTFFQKGV